MFPTIPQYKKWSLPAKYSMWGLILALIPIGVSVRDWVISVPEYTVLAFNYGGSEITIYGDAGDSFETAVIIRGAESGEAGVKAEYYWIRRRFPGYRRISQALTYNHEPGSRPFPTIQKDKEDDPGANSRAESDLPPRLYDVLTIKSWYGHTRNIYFDITDFFNKPSEESREDKIGIKNLLQSTEE